MEGRQIFEVCKFQLKFLYLKTKPIFSCIFCMDYDDRQHLSIFGCSLPSPPTCYGNICYMRQHKSHHYYLYTSGCLNLTQNEFTLIAQRLSSKKPERGAQGEETQLCEVCFEKRAIYTFILYKCYKSLQIQSEQVIQKMDIISQET